jgi:amidase
MSTKWKSRTALAGGLFCAGLMPFGVSAQGFALEEATIADINTAFSQGTLTSQSLVRSYLGRIAAYDSAGPNLNSIITLNPDAITTAAQLDAERQLTGPRGPLHGIPVLLKDNIDTSDMKTTGGFLGLGNSTPPDDAFLAEKLRVAGAVILGKASLTEFANFLANGMPAGYSSLNGYTFNPYNPTTLAGGDGRPALSPGGSSAGSAVAVAANLVTVSVGTETSGSILSPGNQNSIVGIKPTVGLISRDGVIPIAASQDTAGPFGRTVADAATLLGVLAGFDPNDAATSTSPGITDYRPYLSDTALQGTRIGVPQNLLNNLNAELRGIVNRAIAVLEGEGATIVYQNLSTSLPASSVLTYEFKRDLNAYLASLGAASPIQDIEDVDSYIQNYPGYPATGLPTDPNHPFKYGKARLEASTIINLDPGSADTATYVADRARDLLTAKTNGIDLYMDTYNLDTILFPGTTGAGIGARAGYPSIIVPAGYQNNLSPYGITFLGKAYTESDLIGYAYDYEQASQVRLAPTSTPAIPEPSLVGGLGGFCLLMLSRRFHQQQK